LMFFFFFQAEDGIRDDLVTGVQTCALPISERRSSWTQYRNMEGKPAGTYSRRASTSAICASRSAVVFRSWVTREARLRRRSRSRSEEHTSELQSPDHLVCRLLLEKKNIAIN